MTKRLFTAAALGAGLSLLEACGGSPSALSEAAERGRVVFFEVNNPETNRTCANCHGLRYEGTPLIPGMGNLDQRKPTKAQVKKAVEGGIGAVMVAAKHLTPEQIDDVSTYVSEVVGRPPKPGVE